MGNWTKEPSSIDAIEDRFTKLAAVWEEQSTYLSSMEKQCMLAPYQEIMTMGWSVVPLILKRMELEPDWWFWALRFITSVNPVPESAEGDLAKMTDAWLQWGRRNHLMVNGDPKRSAGDLHLQETLAKIAAAEGKEGT